MSNNQDTLRTVQEVMERFKVSERTVRRWIRSGEMEVIRVGRSIRFEEREIKRFLDLRRRARTRQEQKAK